jgi:hypothetical protein
MLRKDKEMLLISMFIELDNLFGAIKWEITWIKI